MSSELKLTNIKHPSSGSNNLVLASDGSATIAKASVDVSNGSITTSSTQKQTVVDGGLVSAYGIFNGLSDSSYIQDTVPTITGQTSGSFFSVQNTHEIEITSTGLYLINVNSQKFDCTDGSYGYMSGLLNVGSVASVTASLNRMGMGTLNTLPNNTVPDSSNISANFLGHFVITSTNKRVKVEIIQNNALNPASTITYYWVIQKIGTI